MAWFGAWKWEYLIIGLLIIVALCLLCKLMWKQQSSVRRWVYITDKEIRMLGLPQKPKGAPSVTHHCPPGKHKGKEKHTLFLVDGDELNLLEKEAGHKGKELEGTSVKCYPSDFGEIGETLSSVGNPHRNAPPPNKTTVKDTRFSNALPSEDPQTADEAIKKGWELRTDYALVTDSDSASDYKEVSYHSSALDTSRDTGEYEKESSDDVDTDISEYSASEYDDESIHTDISGDSRSEEDQCKKATEGLIKCVQPHCILSEKNTEECVNDCKERHDTRKTCDSRDTLVNCITKNCNDLQKDGEKSRCMSECTAEAYEKIYA